MKTPSITKTGFKAFLEAHPRMKFRCRGACACPIARYVSEVGDGIAYVAHDNYCIIAADGNNGRDRKTPQWAKDFIYAFDGNAADATGRPTYLTGKKALEIFNGL